MSSRYAAIPTSERHDDIDDEVQAAFDYRDDDDEHDASESQPLNRNASQPTPAPRVPPPITTTHADGTYNFESVDYDFPPPGSPPPPSANALPNNFGNSNGVVPNFTNTRVYQPQRSWWRRVATVLPHSVADRLGINPGQPSGRVGGGTNNDGVFANVTAKPTAPVRVQHGDETYIVPEDTQQEAPPSYAAAQADAVPPYWETTVHAPFSPDSLGEMIVDSLPTGSIFSFCWNMLVSISFQFVGFLLTYLLHTSHAARLGSRAGLGVTLIQYGFALRGKLDDTDSTDGNDQWTAEPHPTFGSIQEADAWFQAHGGNSTAISQEQAAFIADVTTEWLSFFLMTIGWFVLLTSILGFYRVKRWEKGILASQQGDTTTTAAAATPSATLAHDMERSFAIRGMSRIEFLRNGFRLGGNQRNDEAPTDLNTTRGETEETAAMLHINPEDPRAVSALQREMRLRADLREAGLI